MKWWWLRHLGLTLAALLLLFRPAAASTLWQIEKDGRTHHLFGTIHVADADVVALPAHVEQVVRSARQLVVEVISSDDARRTMAQRTLLASNTLKNVLGDELFASVASAAQMRGVSPEGLAHLKPWAVALMLNVPLSSSEPVLDERLQYRFEGSGRPVHALETLDEQLDIFDQLPLAGQIAFLESSLAQLADFDANMAQMKSLYLKGDLEAIQDYSRQQLDSADDPLMRQLMHRLLEERNMRMFERVQSRLTESGTLIAVGALHLPGQQGLLQLFRQAGYTVLPVAP